MFVFALSLFVGVLLMAVGLPLALGKVPRNNWYGFRVGKALEDDHAWDQANRASGRWLVIAGVAMAMAAMVNIAMKTNIAVAALVNGLVATLGIIVAVAAGFAAMSADDFRR